MDWITGAITRLHERHPDLAFILAEILHRQDRLTELLEALAKVAPTTSHSGFVSAMNGMWGRAVLLIILAPASGLTLKEALNLMLG
ncbi:MAG TPA: hypothetical protein VFU31_29905 [Candidatus Binatia bacterium]|nr:hypothetical protein [Candidatus Binatia bacterium]